MPASPPRYTPLQPRPRHYGITLAVLTLAALTYALTQTLVAPALPAMQRDLGVSTTTISFVLTAYLVSASIATPIVGRIGDMFGKGRVLVLALMAFGTGSLMSALAGSIELLIIGRVVQGIGGAIFPLAYGIVRDEFPPARVGLGIGLISAMFGIGAAGGLVLSGLIVDSLSYEWIFWLVLPLIALAGLMTHWFIPESRVRDRVSSDWGGALLFSLGLVTLLLAVSQTTAWGWLSVETIVLVAAAIGILVFWMRFESRHPHPLVDMQVMRERPVWTANLAALCLGVGMFGSFILIPMYAQIPATAGYGFGSGVTGAGLLLLPSACMMLVASPLAGWLGDRVGSKLPLALGTAIAASSFALLAAQHDHRWAIYVASAIFGVGAGLSLAAVANLIVAAVDERRTGVAAGINTIMRMIGAAIGGQVAAAIVAGSATAGGLPAESGFTIGFIFSGAVVGLAFVFALLVPGPLLRPGPSRRRLRSGSGIREALGR